ncbi:hypothetical protein CAC42_7644 [Sphaceloma murrayae]|uniref:Uncharacterized protein n=1 Tax=Sphaceloma murrayae TaxID=2082308 RepID=A0A2K1QTA5_9PEZI|nr:hypothetical protein CAC42_7644 [Sphaceloma murrayae]
MHFPTLLTAAMLALTTSAHPTTTLEKRAAMCGQWDNVVSGKYTLYNNLWGRDAGSGSQCTTLDSASSSTIKWNTKWSWSGGNTHVKSYANVVTKINKVAVSRISTMLSSWEWSYTGSGVVANVAYDLFTGNTATSDALYEIMIWTGALGGAGPISSTGSPIATVNLGNRLWKLYKGPNGQMTVFSFVPASGQGGSYNGDVMAFINYLVKSQGMPSSQILQSVGAGTEPFVGSNAVFTTTKYTLAPVYK